MDFRLFPVVDLAATGRNIQRLRKARGLSVQSIQEWLGLESPRAVYKWLRGQSLPTVEHLLALSRLLDVTMDDIVAFHLQENIGYGAEERDCSDGAFLLPMAALHASLIMIGKNAIDVNVPAVQKRQALPRRRDNVSALYEEMPSVAFSLRS